MNRRAQLAVIRQVFDNELGIRWETADERGATIIRWSNNDGTTQMHSLEETDDLPALWRWLDQVALTFHSVDPPTA